VEKSEERKKQDRRRRPTQPFSRYTFWGRRKDMRRKEDREKGGYVDRYHPRLLFLILLIVGLNILDSLFTLMILECGGHELNPIVQSAIAMYGDHFWIWKFGIVSVNVTVLCLCSKFRYVEKILLGICLVYLTVVLYQVLLMLFFY
jgi:hypothetical protein